MTYNILAQFLLKVMKVRVNDEVSASVFPWISWISLSNKLPMIVQPCTKCRYDPAPPTLNFLFAPSMAIPFFIHR